MTYALEQFIDEAIQLELNAAEIYSIFSKTIPEDANFWATLAWEERNHASILKTGKDILLPQDQFPLEVLPSFIQPLIETNDWLRSLIREFALVSPDRETTFKLALKIEKSSGEQHFQRVMETGSDSKIIKVFQELCEDDLYHLRRILEYMKNIGIYGQQNSSESETPQILIVMNDALLRNLLTTILEPEGRIETVSDGREGLEKLKEGVYQLVIAALETPLVDSMEFYNTAKEIDQKLDRKILFFTAAPTDEHLAFFQRENLRYLTKSPSIDEIRRTAVDILRDQPQKKERR